MTVTQKGTGFSRTGLASSFGNAAIDSNWEDPAGLDQRDDDEADERAGVNGKGHPEKEALPSFGAQIAVAGHVLQELGFFHVPTMPRGRESRANRW